jgi:hypothetical protein
MAFEESGVSIRRIRPHSSVAQRHPTSGRIAFSTYERYNLLADCDLIRPYANPNGDRTHFLATDMANRNREAGDLAIPSQRDGSPSPG